jgi:hypothetical protein
MTQAFPGRAPISPEFPLFRALAKRGLSLRQWCAKTGRKAPNFSLYASGKRAITETEARRIETEFGGEVPASSWPRRRPGA